MEICSVCKEKIKGHSSVSVQGQLYCFKPACKAVQHKEEKARERKERREHQAKGLCRFQPYEYCPRRATNKGYCTEHAKLRCHYQSAGRVCGKKATRVCLSESLSWLRSRGLYLGDPICDNHPIYEWEDEEPKAQRSP